MASDDDTRLKAIRQNVALMEHLHAARRRFESMLRQDVKLKFEKQNISPHADGLPDLPPRLPRPEYATQPNLVGKDDNELRFYMACEGGLLDEVKTFVQQRGPTHAVRQFGLEMASFAVQTDVARYLLEHQTTLYDGIFLQSWWSPPGNDLVCLFDRGRPNPLPMVELFLRFGWHPNQLWSAGPSAAGNIRKAPILYSVKNKPLLTLLLRHGADPCLDRHTVGLYDRQPLDRQCNMILNSAVFTEDPEIVDLLIKHGADPAAAHPLHSVARWASRGCTEPFSRRRQTAEYLLASKIVDIDDVKYMTFPDMICRPQAPGENMTPFIYACALRDWEFAWWLLEHGANPYLMDGRAFEPMSYTSLAECYSPPSDPRVVVDLVNEYCSRQKAIMRNSFPTLDIDFLA